MVSIITSTACFAKRLRAKDLDRGARPQRAEFCCKFPVPPSCLGLVFVVDQISTNCIHLVWALGMGACACGHASQIHSPDAFSHAASNEPNETPESCRRFGDVAVVDAATVASGTGNSGSKIRLSLKADGSPSRKAFDPAVAAIHVSGVVDLPRTPTKTAVHASSPKLMSSDNFAVDSRDAVKPLEGGEPASLPSPSDSRKSLIQGVYLLIIRVGPCGVRMTWS